MTNKFHWNKFGIIQIWCKGTLTNPNLKYTQIALSHKYKTKVSQIPNTKSKLCTNQWESHKSNSKVATHQERTNHQTAKPKPSGNKPLSLFQIATHKYQRTKQEKHYLFATIALCLNRRIKFASISKTKKD